MLNIRLDKKQVLALTQANKPEGLILTDFIAQGRPHDQVVVERLAKMGLLVITSEPDAPATYTITDNGRTALVDNGD